MASAHRVSAPEGSYRIYATRRSPFKDSPSEREAILKIDAIVREHTGYKSLAEMCKNNPTLRAPPGSSKRTKRDFAILRKAYRNVTGKTASGGRR